MSPCFFSPPQRCAERKPRVPRGPRRRAGRPLARDDINPTALADLEIARANLDRVQGQAQAEARVAEQEWSAAEYAYSRGATGALDMLDARRSLKGVELDELQARLEAARSRARREAALEVEPQA